MIGNVKKNLGLQTIYQLTSIFLPFITAPYLARKLGATQLGIFSYTSSVVAYFTLAAMLGTVNYGTRSIAATKDDRNTRSTVFWNIFALQILFTSTAIIAYVIYLLFICRDNKIIASLQIISLFSCMFDINWFFFGVEEFKITVTRSMIIKLLTVALILLLVKTEKDLWIYTTIMLGGTLVSQIILFIYLPRYVDKPSVSISEIKRHLKPNLILFVPLVAMSVYHTMDKTMLGLLSNYEQSGFYYNSDKVINIPMCVIGGIGTVMLPRMSSLLSEGKGKEADRLFMMTMEGVAALSIALACGIAAVSKEFIPIFYGSGYEPCIMLTIVFTPILIVKSFSLIVRTQYLIPMNMETKFTKSVVCGAIVNLILNLVLIPNNGALGAVIATFFAELVACIVQFTALRGRGLGLEKLFRETLSYLVIGLCMIAVVRAMSLMKIRIVMKLLVEIIVGAVFYGILCILFWRNSHRTFYTDLARQRKKRI